VTTRGFNEADMDEIAGCIDTVLAAIGTPGEAAALEAVKQRVGALTGRHPLPYKM
jgi:glycine hydroxymethyltransferase